MAEWTVTCGGPPKKATLAGGAHLNFSTTVIVVEAFLFWPTSKVAQLTAAVEATRHTGYIECRAETYYNSTGDGEDTELVQRCEKDMSGVPLGLFA